MEVKHGLMWLTLLDFKNTWWYHIEQYFGRNSMLFFEGHATNDYTPYTYKTTDFGKHGNQLLLDIDGFVRNIQEDFTNENLLYLGTEKGLYITIDGGANWSHLPIKCFSCLYGIKYKTNSLVMATHGRGVII
jgi:hypothetical protein